MISTTAQNSLLKIMEDIPKHLIIMFATTDPQKVLGTIKSRCQLTLEVRKQSVKDMAKRLMEISKLENLTVSEAALEVIVRKGNRVPRECINLLESIAKTYDKQITMDIVRDYLGGEMSNLYIEYFEAANSSLEDILLFIKKLKDADIKIKDFVSGLIAFVLDSMYIKHGISLEDYTTDYANSVKQLFKIYTSSDFDMLLQIVEYLSNNINVEDDAKNDMLLTITAMRISKIQLLASGLADAQSEAITENKVSLYEHSKKLKANNAAIAEQMRIDINSKTLKDEFDEVEQVVGTQNLLDNVQIPEVEITEDEDDLIPKKKNLTLGEEVDSFFDN